MGDYENKWRINRGSLRDAKRSQVLNSKHHSSRQRRSKPLYVLSHQQAINVLANSSILLCQLIYAIVTGNDSGDNHTKTTQEYQHNLPIAATHRFASNLVNFQ
jgi:hypothetical protein